MSLSVNKEYSKKLNKYITRPNKWYTGLSVKKYIKKSIFNLIDNFYNPAINASRWSAYAHLDLNVSFRNIIQKYYLTEESRVIVHPLLPKNLIEILKETGCNIYFIDLDLSTLGLIQENLETYLSLLSNQGLYPDLIVNYNTNGIFSTLEKELEITESRSIPTLLVSNNFQINTGLVQIFQKITLGSVILKSTPNFYLNDLFDFVDQKANFETFLSFHVEDRTKSIPEYHLKESHDFYKKLISSFYYIYNDRLFKRNLFKKIVWDVSKKFVFEKDYLPKDITEAENFIKSSANEITLYALPDLVFDYLIEQQLYYYNDQIISIQKSLYFQEATKQLHNFLQTYITQTNSQNDFIPELEKDSEYLEITFYTQNKSDWIKYFSEQNIKCFDFGDYDESLEFQSNLKNARVVYNNGLRINLSDYINMSNITV
jgi:hypothetical protein